MPAFSTFACARLFALITLFLAPEMTTSVSEVANLTVRWDAHGVTIVRVERTLQPKTAPLIRYRGRFEARAVQHAGAGDKTLDFVRFDFPLLAPAESIDEMTDDARRLGEKLRANVTATTTVRVPLPRGATAISVWDSAAHRAVLVALPPPGSTATPPPAASTPTPTAPRPAAAGAPAPVRSGGAAGTRR